VNNHALLMLYNNREEALFARMPTLSQNLKVDAISAKQWQCVSIIRLGHCH